MTKQPDPEDSHRQFPPTPPSLLTRLSPGPPLPPSLAFEPLPPSSYSQHSKYTTSTHENTSAVINGGGGGGNYYNRGIPSSTRGTTNSTSSGNHSLSVAHLLNSDNTSPHASNYYTSHTEAITRNSVGKMLSHAGGGLGMGNGRDEPIRGYFEGVNEAGMGGNEIGNTTGRRVSITMIQSSKRSHLLIVLLSRRQFRLPHHRNQ